MNITLGRCRREKLQLPLTQFEPGAIAPRTADKIAEQDPLAVQVTKRVFQLPREAHPWADDLGQAILFESEAKFDRMQAFLDRRKK